MQMKKSNWHGLILPLVALVATSLCAQQPRSAHHSLWKVEGKASVLYLMGSVHALKAENYPLPQEMEAAFTNSPIVAFETDISALEDMGTQLKILSKSRLPEGETLASQLSPAVYTKFTNQLQETGMPVMMFDQLQPSIAAMSLVVLEFKKLGLDPENGLDKHFYGLARKEHKTIVPLETVDFQIDMITDFTKEEGELLMKTTLEDISTTKKELTDLVKAWQTGDTDKLDKLLNDASREAPAIFKRLVTDRNHRWVPKIEELLRGGTNAVVIVGSGHLVGKDGVAELLRQKGLKVTQQ
jgi:uncharacterized protein